MLQNHNQHMRTAIATAQDAQLHHGVAVGAVLVDPATNSIVAKGASMVGVLKDPTAHAEINCIRQAAKIRNSDDLYGLILYSTLEPCHMCLSAAAWARIAEVYFGAYRKDVDETLFDIKGDFSDEQEGQRMNLRENTVMRVAGGILEVECAQLLRGYHDQARHNHI